MIELRVVEETAETEESEETDDESETDDDLMIHKILFEVDKLL
mgnify:CR=1 FL=1